MFLFYLLEWFIDEVMNVDSYTGPGAECFIMRLCEKNFTGRVARRTVFKAGEIHIAAFSMCWVFPGIRREKAFRCRSGRHHIKINNSSYICVHSEKEHRMQRWHGCDFCIRLAENRKVPMKKSAESTLSKFVVVVYSELFFIFMRL